MISTMRRGYMRLIAQNERRNDERKFQLEVPYHLESMKFDVLYLKSKCCCHIKFATVPCWKVQQELQLGRKRWQRGMG